MSSFRKQQKPLKHNYAIVSDVENKNSVEMVPDPDSSESKRSLLALKLTIKDIHDCSENEKDTPNIVSMKNVLYEPGECGFFFCVLTNNVKFTNFVDHHNSFSHTCACAYTYKQVV